METASQPQPPSPEQDKERRREAHRDLVRCYKRFCASDDGRRLLADLEAKFHWGDDPYASGIQIGDLSFRCGTHSPLRHIHKMRDTVLAPLGKKRKAVTAKSGLAPRE